MENYYEILGVSETASQEEIKKAFRAKSKVMHPDKGGNEEDFKKINEAYDTIGDDSKRAQYDQQRNNPFANMGGGDPFDIFNSFFNGGFGNRQPQPRKAPDKIVELNVGVVDSFLGKEITIDFDRKKKCDPCNGTGGDKQTCHVCNGTGRLTQRVGNSFLSNIIQTMCGMCGGRGFKFTNMCNTCFGEGTTNENVKLNLKLPTGISDGQFIKAGGYGDYYNGVFGDTILKINIQPQSGFEKNGGDLVYNYYLTMDDINKDSITVPYPTGELSVQLPKEIDTSKPLRIRGKGFKSENGDFYINLNFRHTRL